MESAGVLPFCIRGSDIYFLIGKETRFDRRTGSTVHVWQDFGGTPDRQDRTPVHTAIRELHEETLGLLRLDDSNSGFQLPFEYNYAASRGKYVMYICAFEYIPLEKFKIRYHQAAHSEKENFAYVRARDLMKLVQREHADVPISADVAIGAFPEQITRDHLFAPFSISLNLNRGQILDRIRQAEEIAKARPSVGFAAKPERGVRFADKSLSPTDTTVEFARILRQSVDDAYRYDYKEFVKDLESVGPAQTWVHLIERSNVRVDLRIKY